MGSHKSALETVGDLYVLLLEWQRNYFRGYRCLEEIRGHRCLEEIRGHRCLEEIRGPTCLEEIRAYRCLGDVNVRGKSETRCKHLKDRYSPADVT